MQPLPLPDYITIGVVKGAHGVSGALRVTPTTDSPTRFKQLESLRARSADGVVRNYSIQELRIRSDIIYLTFQEITSREEALALRGASLEIPRSQALSLPADEYYPFELVGLEVVTEKGEVLGSVEDVWDLTANAVLVVRQDDCQEKLIPLIKKIIVQVDLEAGRLVVCPMEGLLE